ncbi:diguanylate cyclase domain-containing protein [Thauera humireducens]|uniref:diguanylate cyclase domain-containing protein n=1 Tax=Thauera humireducens TaxID=1134435 RepID=UPI00311F44B0
MLRRALATLALLSGPLLALADTTVEPAAAVRLCVDPDWPPYEWLDETGRHRGIAADLVRLIAKRAGLNLQIVRTSTWDESVSLARTGRCDALSFLNQTPERDTWLRFTQPYFFDRNVIITHAEHAAIPDLAALPKGTTVALPTATSIMERIGHDFPHLRVLPVGSEIEAFGMVEAREADLTLRALTVAAYTIKHEGWFNLKIAGELPDFGNRMRIGVSGGKTELVRALDAAIATLTPEELDEIVNRHVAIDMPARTDYTLVAEVVAGFAVVLLLAYLWIRHLGRLNRRLADLGERLRQDIAAREQAERALKDSEQHYRSVVEMAQEGILVVQDGRVIYANPAFSELLGYSGEELAQLDAFDALIAPEDLPRARTNHQRRLAGEETEQRYPLRLMRKSGRMLWAETSGVRINWNGRPATLNIVNDITARKAAEDSIRHLAHHDPLTGLPNRVLLQDRLERALASAQRNGSSLAMLFIDLDGFKPVNDRYGHDTGDALLQAVAKRLRGTLRHSDTAARIGGDEFVVLLPVLAETQDAGLIAAKLRTAIASPFEIDGHRITISASIGLALYPRDGDTASELMRTADGAMYADKRQHAG